MSVIINYWVRPTMMKTEAHGHLFRFDSRHQPRIASAALYQLRTPACSRRRYTLPMPSLWLALPSRSPVGGPVWDTIGITSDGAPVFVEARRTFQRQFQLRHVHHSNQLDLSPRVSSSCIFLSSNFKESLLKFPESRDFVTLSISRGPITHRFS